MDFTFPVWPFIEGRFRNVSSGRGKWAQIVLKRPASTTFRDASEEWRNGGAQIVLRKARVELHTVAPAQLIGMKNVWRDRLARRHARPDIGPGPHVHRYAGRPRVARGSTRDDMASLGARDRAGVDPREACPRANCARRTRDLKAGTNGSADGERVRPRAAKRGTTCILDVLAGIG